MSSTGRLRQQAAPDTEAAFRPAATGRDVLPAARMVLDPFAGFQLDADCRQGLGRAAIGSSLTPIPRHRQPEAGGGTASLRQFSCVSFLDCTRPGI